MPIKFKKQNAASVGTPAVDFVQFFVDTDGVAKTKDSDGNVTDVGGGGGLHAPTHGLNGSDPVSLDATQIVTGTIDPERITTAADGEYLKVVSGAIVGAAAPGGGSGGWASPFQARPAVADSWDLDPMTMSDPDPTNYGWTVKEFAGSHALLTRSGDVDFNSFPPAGTFRSTIYNGQLWVQGAHTAFLQITRAADHSHTYKARLRPAKLGYGFGGTASGTWLYVTDGGSDLGTPSSIRSYWVGIDATGTSAFQVTLFTGNAANPRGNINLESGYNPDGVYYIVPVISGGNRVYARIHLADNGITPYDTAGATEPFAGGIQEAGVVLGTAHASQLNVHYIDYIRRQPAGQFP